MSAFAENACQRLLPWSDYPIPLKMFVSGVSNRTDKTTAYASHYMHIMYTHHSKLAHLALHLCREVTLPPLSGFWRLDSAAPHATRAWRYPPDKFGGPGTEVHVGFPSPPLFDITTLDF